MRNVLLAVFMLLLFIGFFAMPLSTIAFAQESQDESSNEQDVTDQDQSAPEDSGQDQSADQPTESDQHDAQAGADEQSDDTTSTESADESAAEFSDESMQSNEHQQDVDTAGDPSEGVPAEGPAES